MNYKNILIIFIILYILLLIRGRMVAKQLYLLPENPKTNEMKKLLDLCVKYLNKHNISYWLHCGTLLGAIRNNKFIPFDDDLDICIYDNNSNNILNCINDLRKILNVNNDRNIGYQLSFQKNITKNIHIDFFIISKINNKLLPSKWCLNNWPNEWYYFHDVYPLKTITMYDAQYNIPNKSIKILNKFYGHSWNSKVIVDCHWCINLFDKLCMKCAYFTNKQLVEFPITDIKEIQDDDDSSSDEEED